jgi:hypothetical protein
MGITVATTRVACNTGTGNQDITADLGDLTPAAALFTIVAATADGTPADHAVMGTGAATSTSERWAIAGSAEHNVGTTDCYRRMETDRCVLILNPADGTVDGEADFVSFITNGVRINWSDAPSAAYYLIVDLFAGTDLSAKALTFTMAATEDDTVDVTTLAFEADVLLVVSHCSSTVDSTDDHCFISLGVVLNKDPLQQYSLQFKTIDDFSTSTVGNELRDDYGVGASTGGLAPWDGEFSDFDASGFSCTTRNSTGGAEVGVLALAFAAAVDFWAGVLDTPTSTGNQGVTDPAFTPQWVHCALSQLPAVNTGYGDGNAGSIGVCSFDEDDENCSSVQDEDGEATTDTQSLSDDTAVNLPNDDGSAAHVAAFVSFDANGWTWNFTTTEGTAVKLWALAIEAEGAAPTPGAMPILSDQGVHSVLFGGQVVR